jgi:argininosuccinate synthase
VEVLILLLPEIFKTKRFEVHNRTCRYRWISAEELESIATRAYELGSAKHTNLTIVDKYYDKAIKYLIF